MPLWAIIVAHFASNYGSYVLQNYLPSYLKEQLHYDFASSGYISSVPNLVKVIITLVAGFVSDFLVYKLQLSNPTVRRIMTTIGLAGPALAMFFSGSFKVFNSAIYSLKVLSGVSVRQLLYSL